MPHDGESRRAAEPTGIKHWREKTVSQPTILEWRQPFPTDLCKGAEVGPLPHFPLPTGLLYRHSLAMDGSLTRASCHSSNVATGLVQTLEGTEGGARLV